MKKFAIVIALGLLSACKASPQDQSNDMQRVANGLPDGCTLHYAGDVRIAGHDIQHPSRIFFTKCGNIVTTSETHTVQNGKNTAQLNTVTITEE